MDDRREVFDSIDYDAYKARAHEMRRQEITRLTDLFIAWLRSPAKPRVVAGAPGAIAVASRLSRC